MAFCAKCGRDYYISKKCPHCDDGIPIWRIAEVVGCLSLCAMFVGLLIFAFTSAPNGSATVDSDYKYQQGQGGGVIGDWVDGAQKGDDKKEEDTEPTHERYSRAGNAQPDDGSLVDNDQVYHGRGEEAAVDELVTTVSVGGQIYPVTIRNHNNWTMLEYDFSDLPMAHCREQAELHYNSTRYDIRNWTADQRAAQAAKIWRFRWGACDRCVFDIDF